MLHVQPSKRLNTTNTRTSTTAAPAKESAISVYLEESEQFVIAINSMAGKAKTKGWWKNSVSNVKLLNPVTHK